MTGVLIQWLNPQDTTQFNLTEFEMTNQIEFSMKQEKAARKCIEWQERLRCAEEDGDKELICYCLSKVEKYLAEIKKIKLEPDYKSNCRSKFDCQVGPKKNISRKKANTRD